MLRRSGRLALGGCLVLVSLLTLGSAGVRAEEKSDELLRIGLLGSLFRDVPDHILTAMNQPFNALLTAQTGLRGELIKSGDAQCLAKQLTSGEVQLGIFLGVDFAWARQKYPDLKPLMIAVREKPFVQCHLVVHKDCPAKSLGDLKGKILCVPAGTPPHCALFLERNCQECGGTPEAVFKETVRPAGVEEALDKVRDGTAQAIVVDSVAFEWYKYRKPGSCNKLRILQQSEIFPAPVIAYCPGTLTPAVLKRFRNGLASANESIIGQQLLTMWKLTGFEAVPEDYEKTLKAIVKKYPPPAAKDMK